MKRTGWQLRPQPGWRALTALVLLVSLAHMLLLRASPAQLGGTAEVDALGAKTLITRTIESAPQQQQIEAAATAAVRPARPLKNSPKKVLDRPAAAIKPQETASELIASAAPAVALEAAADTAAVATPTQTLTPASTTDLGAAAVQASSDAAPYTGSKTTHTNTVNLPGSVRLEYKVTGQAKGMAYSAESELSWKSEGGRYEAQMKVSAFLIGSRSMTSAGKITASGLAPTRFSDRFKSELAAHFEPDKGKITFSANTPDAAWIEGVQDRVSVFFQLGGVLAANPSGFPSGSNITFLTVGPRDADNWTFVIEAEEALTLMGTAFPTLKLTRKPRKEFDQKVEIWYAPSLGYLPVRNRITQQNGDVVDQELTSIGK